MEVKRILALYETRPLIETMKKYCAFWFQEAQCVFKSLKILLNTRTMLATPIILHYPPTKLIIPTWRVINKAGQSEHLHNHTYNSSLHTYLLLKSIENQTWHDFKAWHTHLLPSCWSCTWRTRPKIFYILTVFVWYSAFSIYLINYWTRSNLLEPFSLPDNSGVPN